MTATLLSKLPCKEGYQLEPGTRIIPARPKEYGTAWHQPTRNEMRFHVNTQAVDGKPDMVYMSKRSLDDLSEYSRSMPSGVYPGKMWKAKVTRLDGTKEWRLCWYGEVPGRPDLCSNHECTIVLLEVIQLLNPGG